MRKKGYKGRCEKKNLSKSMDVCRSYDAIQSVYADILQQDENIQEIRCNVLLDGLSEGDYTSDFVCIRKDGEWMVRECVCPQGYDARLIIIDMKQYLSSIVQGYGYKNVKEFLTEYRASKAEYSDYQSAVVKWEQQTGNKAESDSLKAKLQRKQQEAKELNRHNKHQKKYIRDVR